MAAAARVNAAHGATRRASITNSAQVTKNLISTTGPNFISGVSDFNVLAGLTSELAKILRGDNMFIAVSQTRCPAYPVPPVFQNGEALATALETTLEREYPGPRTDVHTTGLANVRAMAPDAVKALCRLPDGVGPPDTPGDAGHLGSFLNTGNVRSSEGQIPNPTLGEPAGSYIFDNHGEMRIVGAILNMVECALDTEGRIVIRGGHSLSYVRMNSNWYKADNEKGFLESKTNPLVPPYWDLKYGSIGAWYPFEMYLYFSNYTILSSIPREVAGTRNGEYSPFQYNTTCSPDSMSAIIMLADGYKQVFEQGYNLFTGDDRFRASIDELIRLLSSPVRARAVIEDISGIKVALKNMKDAQEPVETAAKAAAAARGLAVVTNQRQQGKSEEESQRMAFLNASVASSHSRALMTNDDLRAKARLGNNAISRAMNLGTKAGISVPYHFKVLDGHVAGAQGAVASCILDPALSAEEIASRILHPTIFLRGKRVFDSVLTQHPPYTKNTLLRNININQAAEKLRPHYLLSPYLDIKYDSAHEDKILGEFYGLIIKYINLRKVNSLTPAKVYLILSTKTPADEFKMIQTVSFLILMIIRKRTWEGKPKFTHYRGHVIGNAQNAGSRKIRKNRKTRTRKN